MKLTKVEAQYRDAAPSGRGHCEFCTMWQAGGCTSVQGEIMRSGTCKLFERRIAPGGVP